MKLMIDVRTMASEPSGIGMYIFHFAKYLFQNGESKIILLTDVIKSKEISYFIKQNVEVVEYGSLVKKSVEIIRYFHFIKKNIRRSCPDYFWEPNNIIPIRMRFSSTKIVMTVHDIFPISIPQYFGIIYQCYFRYGLRMGLANANILFFSSDKTKREVEKRYSISKNKEKYVVFSIAGNWKEKFSIDKNYFLYIGNLEKRKGVDILIESYLLYKKAGGEKKLVLAGKLRDRKISAILQRAFKATNTIEVLGYIDEEKKWKLYKECSCFVFPSIDEGFGIPPLEAMQCGKPVILSDIPIFREVIGDCVNYFELSKDKNMAKKHLCDVMLNYKEADVEKYRVKVNNYCEDRLGKYLKGVFRMGE